MNKPSYVFPGISIFVQRAAADGGQTQYQMARAETSWHLKQLGNGLGQLPTMRPEDRLGMLDHVREIYGSLRLALEAADLAIDEVTTALAPIGQNPEIQPCPELKSPEQYTRKLRKHGHES